MHIYIQNCILYTRKCVPTSNNAIAVVLYRRFFLFSPTRPGSLVVIDRCNLPKCKSTDMRHFSLRCRNVRPTGSIFDGLLSRNPARLKILCIYMRTIIKKEIARKIDWEREREPFRLLYPRFQKPRSSPVRCILFTTMVSFDVDALRDYIR
jgi:hypothetical protein